MPSATPLHLPVELWTKIIHESGHKDWIALCRVCWLLYQIAQPCLFEDIILRVRKRFRRKISDGRIGDPRLQFKRTIDQRQELGAHVRSLAIDMVDCARHNHRERYPLLFEIYLFPNLERLHVWRIHFDLELCNILHSHPRLKSVTVVDCTLDESLAIARIDRDHSPHSSISTVNVLYVKHDPVPIHAWAALAPAKLESLVLTTSIAYDAGSISRRIMRPNKTSFLTTLSLDGFSPAVVRFLIASPQLRHFILDSWVNEASNNLMPSPLPADAIPFLEEYCGPAEISPTFIRGRPVHTVKFIFPRPIPEDRLVEIIISLRYSTVPLTSLGLDLRNVTWGSWLSHIPVTVRYLAVEHIDWLDFEMWLPALSHLTSLHTFSGKFMTVLHQEEVIKISNTCPSLRKINNGRNRWFIGEQHVWELFMASMS